MPRLRATGSFCCSCGATRCLRSQPRSARPRGATWRPSGARLRELLLEGRKPMAMKALRKRFDAYGIAENPDGTVRGKPIWFVRYAETYINPGPSRHRQTFQRQRPDAAQIQRLHVPGRRGPRCRRGRRRAGGTGTDVCAADAASARSGFCRRKCTGDPAPPGLQHAQLLYGPPW